jgi:hypothetical protein
MPKSLKSLQESESHTGTHTCEGLHEVRFKTKHGHTACGQHCHVGGDKKKAELNICPMLLFSLSEGMV